MANAAVNFFGKFVFGTVAGVPGILVPITIGTAVASVFHAH